MKKVTHGKKSVAPGSVAAIVPAAGLGSRLGHETPKAFVKLGGRPMVYYSLRTLESMREVGRVVLAVPEGWEKKAGRMVRGWKFGKVCVAAGGALRAQSVLAALREVPAEAKWVLVHDAARPFLSADFAREAVLAAGRTGAAAPALDVTDLVKRRAPRGGTESVPREGLFRVQTPQVVRADLLARAIETLPKAFMRSAPDESTLVEALGVRVVYFPGDPENLKITGEEDLRAARQRVPHIF